MSKDVKVEKIFANIIVDITVDALNKSFVYVVPESLVGKVKAGDKVVFPFGTGNKEREGFVLELLTFEQLKNKNFYKNEAYFKRADAIDNLKEIKEVKKDKITANEILLKMAIFLCKEYYTPISTCLNTVLPVKRVVRKNKKQVDAITKYKVNEEEKSVRQDIELNDEQKHIIEDITKEYKKGQFSEHLIFGVTGSGKTEVYIKVIEEVLKAGKQVIVLIPEIALTHQTVIRLKEKFEDNIAIIHSRMSEGDRFIQYDKCEKGETKILVGPRSAVFAPFENLGLIVVDEVNDSSYKSETSPRYNTLQVARFRCTEQNALLLSLSATPNIDLYYNAKNNKNNIYLHKLNKRASSVLPKVTIVDMKEEIKNGNKTIFSNILKEKIRDRLNKKEQVMLYMNRRGYNTIFTCTECSETYKCPHCDVALVSHSDGKLRCHYCGYEIDEPFTCPKCHSKNIEKYGMGTEKLEELCIDLFPDARVLRMDRDTTKEKDGHDKIIERFRNKEADILIGTQMIVKGHDFPNVTLVAIMRADLSLYESSYKAAENTFSLLTQCVGRSGRKIEGESIIQCFDSDSFVMEMIVKQDFEAFYNVEIKNRQKLAYPPFSTLLIIKLSSENDDILSEISVNLKLLIEKNNDTKVVVLGPAKANPEKIKDTYYRTIILKCANIIEAKKYRNLSQKYVDYINKNNIIKGAAKRATETFGVIKIVFDIE